MRTSHRYKDMNYKYIILSILLLTVINAKSYALSVIYIGTQEIVEEVFDDAEDSGGQEFMFTKKEPQVIEEMEVMYILCDSGIAVKISQTEIGTIVELEDIAYIENEYPPLHAAFIACNESHPETFEKDSKNVATKIKGLGDETNEGVAPIKKGESFISHECTSFKDTLLDCIIKVIGIGDN